MSRTVMISMVLLAFSAGAAEQAPKAKAGDDAKTLSGISILGNQEAPKSLVIVPWKSSQLGDTLAKQAGGAKPRRSASR